MTTFCRLCCQNSPDMLPLFETVIGEKLLIEIILSTFGVELENNMNFPSQVCQECFKNVDLLYGFYNKLIETQSLLSQRVKKGELIVGVTHKTNTFNPQENDCETSDRHEKEENSHQNLLVKAESIDIDDNNSEISNNNDIAEFIQEQIEQEPIVIKHELLKSDYEDVDGQAIQTNLQKNGRKRIRCPKEVQTIPNKCYICGPIFENEDEFLAHLEGHKDMLPYECSRCTTASNSIILPNVVLLNKHIETHSFNYICKLCPQRFRASNMLSYHRQTVHNDPTFKHQCEFCGKVFNNSVGLRCHVYTHKQLSMQRYKCVNCQKSFNSLFTLQRHLQTHKKQVQIEREPIGTKQNLLECYNVEVDSNDEKTHSRENEEHQLSKKQTFKRTRTIPNKCYICGPVFGSKRIFNDHLDSHKEMLPYECSQCSTATNPIILSTVALLLEHFETHSFKHVCRQCPLRFKTRNKLFYHTKTVHEKHASKHCCDTCGKVFYNSALFRKHIRGHIYLDTQRYKCQICQKLFRSQFDLQRHELTHTKRNGQFVCKWCDRTFDTVVRCLQHVEQCKANEKRNKDDKASDSAS